MSHSWRLQESHHSPLILALCHDGGLTSCSVTVNDKFFKYKVLTEKSLKPVVLAHRFFRSRFTSQCNGVSLYPAGGPSPP